MSTLKDFFALLTIFCIIFIHKCNAADTEFTPILVGAKILERSLVNYLIRIRPGDLININQENFADIAADINNYRVKQIKLEKGHLGCICGEAVLESEFIEGDNAERVGNKDKASEPFHTTVEEFSKYWSYIKKPGTVYAFRSPIFTNLNGFNNNTDENVEALTNFQNDIPTDFFVNPLAK